MIQTPFLYVDVAVPNAKYVCAEASQADSAFRGMQALRPLAGHSIAPCISTLTSSAVPSRAVNGRSSAYRSAAHRSSQGARKRR